MESFVSSIPWAEPSSEVPKSDVGKGDDPWHDVLLLCMFSSEPANGFVAFFKLLFLAMYFIAVSL